VSETYPVVAAIDFGTHGTGYAWTEVQDDPNESLRRLSFRDDWAGLPSPYPKDLSAVLVAPNGEVTGWGHEARQEWARQNAGSDGHGYGYASGFKMALKADAYRGARAAGAGSLVVDSAHKAYPLVVSYLRRIHQMALKEITDSGYLEKQIRWCLTVPAIWDEEEKQLMRKAAAEAGMPQDRDQLLLALEPEAAAVYCRVHLAHVLGTQREQQAQLAAAGSRFMVIDCGGGTVDITAFRVEANWSGRERLIEIARASGGKVGSEYINEAFVNQVLQDRLGGPAVIERARRECPQALLDLVSNWEGAKGGVQVRPGGPRRAPAIERPVYVAIPGEISDLLTPETIERLGDLPGGNRHRIAISPEEVQRLFDSVLDHLIELVEEELAQMIANNGAQAKPERLLLVGGMSSSKYLQERLLFHFGMRVTLLVPTRPAAAVLFGAVLYGCDPPVIGARLSRYTYGCNIAEHFDPVLDVGRTRHPDEDGIDRCGNRFKVFVTLGETVPADEVRSHNFVPLSSRQNGLYFAFYRTTAKAPRYVDEVGCERIGGIEVKLGEAASARSTQRHCPNEVWRH
jgi:molecular chaperone DnaK (HSP70)